MVANRSADTVEKKVLIQASPSVIYRALTEAKEISQWFCDRAVCEPRVGGELKAFWRLGKSGQGQRGRAVFLSLVPESQVVLDWIDEGGGECVKNGQHTTTYSIKLKRGTSEVTLLDSGPALEDEDAFALLDQGWIGVLRDLKDHCESKQRSERRRSQSAIELDV